MTLSVTTLSTKSLFATLSITLCIKCHFAECHDLFIVMLNVVMLSAIGLNVIVMSIIAECRYAE